MSPSDVCTNSKGHIIIADYSNHRIRMLKDGMISTICGTGSQGSIDGVASVASFNHPTGVCVDKHDNTIISDYFNHKIRMMTNGRVMTVGGNGSKGLSNGNIKSSSFNCPRSVCVDNKGDIIVSDQYNHAIRKIVLKMRDGENQVESVISTISGNGKGGCKDGDLASSTFNQPWGVCVNSNGDIFVSDF